MGEAGGASFDFEKAIASLRAFGAHDQARALEERQRSQAREIVVDVEPENCDAVRLFLAMQTQWRTAALACGQRALLLRTGFDYAALPICASALGIAIGETVLDAFRFLEAKAIDIHFEKQRRALGS